MVNSVGLALLFFVSLQLLMGEGLGLFSVNIPTLPHLLVNGIPALGSGSVSEPTALLIIGLALIGAAYAARR